MAPARGVAGALSAICGLMARRWTAGGAAMARPACRAFSSAAEHTPEPTGGDVSPASSPSSSPLSSPSSSATPSPLAAYPGFHPRTVYEPSSGVPRSYFIGHHRAALDRMRRELATVGLVIECRDLRVPLTAWNPLLETSLGGGGAGREVDRDVDGEGYGASGGVPGLAAAVPDRRGAVAAALAPAERARIIVYTKRDLVVDPATPAVSPSPADLRRLAAFHQHDADAVLFLGADGSDNGSRGSKSARETAKLLAAVRAAAQRHGEQSLTGLRALVVGMPNAGKSTLLNRLRARGMADAGGPPRRRAKAAATGAQPGVTRKLGTPVRVVAADDRDGSSTPGGVLVVDTPGVFVPYVADAEAMLKLALVGCVREGLVPPLALADYLLFQLNRRDPAPYLRLYGLDAPTEDLHALLDAVARRTGKLGRRGAPLHEAAALHLVYAWRHGRLGRFCLDSLDAPALDAARTAARHGPPLSMNQARKREKERRKARAAAKHSGVVADSVTGLV